MCYFLVYNLHATSFIIFRVQDLIKPAVTLFVIQELNKFVHGYHFGFGQGLEQVLNISPKCLDLIDLTTSRVFFTFFKICFLLFLDPMAIGGQTLWGSISNHVEHFLTHA